MTQEQLREQFLQYAGDNLHDDTTLEAIIELLDKIVNTLWEDGYKREANRLNTAEQIIMEVLKNG